MFRFGVLACLLAAPVFVLSSALAPRASECANDLVHEPLVVYEITGSTLSGPIDRELIVYGDGLARLSSASVGIEGKSQLTSVTSQAAIDLLLTLSGHGAFQLCDQPLIISDVPLSTLTLMRPNTDARVHTFSWWAGKGAIEPIEQALNQFIATHFPNF